MKRNGDIVTFTNEEWRDLIDRECRKGLGWTIEEFVDRREHAIHDIDMLLEIADLLPCEIHK